MRARTLADVGEILERTTEAAQVSVAGELHNAVGESNADEAKGEGVEGGDENSVHALRRDALLWFVHA